MPVTPSTSVNDWFEVRQLGRCNRLQKRPLSVPPFGSKPLLSSEGAAEKQAAMFRARGRSLMLSIKRKHGRINDEEYQVAREENDTMYRYDWCRGPLPGHVHVSSIAPSFGHLNLTHARSPLAFSASKRVSIHSPPNPLMSDLSICFSDWNWNKCTRVSFP